MEKKIISFNKILDCIDSAFNEDHLDACKELCALFYGIYRDTECYNKLLGAVDFKKYLLDKQLLEYKINVLGQATKFETINYN